MKQWFRSSRVWLAGAVMLGAASLAQADKLQQAPGFSNLPRDAVVLIAPLDVELFSMTAGGMLEPKADWTAAALGHMKDALQNKALGMGVKTKVLDAESADQNAELLGLHAAVAQSIALHHFGPMQLPSKDTKLDWSFGDAFRGLSERSGARYGLFTWVRDSYASSERVATMIVMSLFGVGVTGGSQVGYASLVDMETGKVLWFNRLMRASGDLREAKPAAESVDALLQAFPIVQ